MTTNRASWSIENSLFLGIAVFVASIYFTYPTDEDWIPLDIGLSQSTYFDRNSLQWSGNVVTVATKSLSVNNIYGEFYVSERNDGCRQVVKREEAAI